MNIILPKEPFSYMDGAAVVEENILYISRQVDFYDLMSELTYAIYGKEICHYCGKPIYPSKLTVDHLIPQTFGGPTITNNMRPSCKACNSRKGNMFENDFFKLIKLEKNGSSIDEINQFKDMVEQKKEKTYKSKTSPLPEDWITSTKIHVVTMNYQLLEPLGKGYKHIERIYARYGCIFKPIVISSNRRLLDGFNVCMFAKIKGIGHKVKVIQLDNVVCMY